MIEIKVCFFTRSLGGLGGAERLVMKWLKRTKLNVDVYTFNNRIGKKVLPSNIKIISIKPKFSSFLPSKISPIIFNFLPTKNYDVVFFISNGFEELVIIRNKGKKNVLYSNTPLKAASSHKIIGWSLKNRFTSFKQGALYKVSVFVYNIFERIAWNRFDKVIFNSKNVMKRALDKKLVNKSTEVSVVYPAVELEKNNLKTKDNEYFLYISRFDIYKRQVAVLKAWKKFVKKYPSYNLILAGATEGAGVGEYIKKVEELIEKIPNVEIVKNASKKQVNELYSGATAGLFVSFEEDFGIAPFEVVAHNKPLIAVDNGGFTEILKDFDAVTWIKDAVDEDEFADNIYKSMLSFMKHLKEQKEKAKKGRQFIKSKKLTWDEFARKLDKEIEKIWVSK